MTVPQVNLHVQRHAFLRIMGYAVQSFWPKRNVARASEEDGAVLTENLETTIATSSMIIKNEATVQGVV